MERHRTKSLANFADTLDGLNSWEVKFYRKVKGNYTIDEITSSHILCAVVLIMRRISVSAHIYRTLTLV